MDSIPSGRYRLLLKGASEILTTKCTRHVVVPKNQDHSQHADSEIKTKAINEVTKNNISQTITFYASQMLRTIALCYRDFESWRIYTTRGIIMEGPILRALGPQECIEVVPHLQVSARSSPEDEKILVETLRSLGEIVGVTGDGINDGPALKTTNIGFSMGIAGTEVAKEASDIILMDDNFASIVKAIMWGRCVNDAVRKFLQFQISTNITAVIITFVSSIASDDEESVLSAVQLLWINIIMDTFAALALATDPASVSLLDRKPDTRGTRLFTADMIKMILGQSIYQVIIILIFHFLGHSILGLDHTDHNNNVVTTLVFSTFVFAQIFNSVNCRRLDNRLNIFEGIFKNRYFIVITLIGTSPPTFCVPKPFDAK